MGSFIQIIINLLKNITGGQNMTQPPIPSTTINPVPPTIIVPTIHTDSTTNYKPSSDSTSSVSSIITVGLDYQLSEHFTFGMLTKTEHREWIEKNRAGGQKKIDILAKLAKEVLEPVYVLMGSLFVTSCFRCPELNTSIGGSKNSQHCEGEACDMEFQGATEGNTLKLAYNKIAFSNIKYSQCIFEFGNWVHCGLIDTVLYPGKIGQKLVASRENGETIYTPITKPI